MFLCTFLLMLSGVSLSEAASNKVTDITWGVNKDNVLRIVIECTGRTEAKAVIKDDALLVTVDGSLKSNVPKSFKVRSDTVGLVSVQNNDNKVAVKLPLLRKLKQGEYKLFALKKDPVTKRPDRIVIDIANAQGVLNTNKTVATTPQVTKKSDFKISGGIKGKKITIDPGHGGSDPGAIGKNGTTEKESNLKIAMKLRDYLSEKGAIVSMTRTSDVDVYGVSATDAQELQARVDVAENNAADLFVSLHCNASTNRDVSGMTTYYYPKTNYDKVIAKAVQDRLIKNFGLDDLGIRQASFYVNKRSSMPSVLVEMAFLSNVKEEKLLRSNWFQTKMANTIAEGIEDYFANA